MPQRRAYTPPPRDPVPKPKPNERTDEQILREQDHYLATLAMFEDMANPEQFGIQHVPQTSDEARLFFGKDPTAVREAVDEEIANDTPTKFIDISKAKRREPK